MIRSFGPAVVMIALSFATPSLASVEYKFNSSPFVNFDFTVPNYINSDQTFDADASGCTSLFSTCSVEFVPGSDNDTINIFLNAEVFESFAVKVLDAQAEPDATYTFDPGSFASPGMHLSDGEFPATLDVVSSVPLPASAPMFGAAVLGLASLSYLANRKKADAA